MEQEIFISYSYRNLDRVSAIKEEIENVTGANCLMDLGGIVSGIPEYDEVIVNGIMKSKVFLFMLSKESQKSEYAIRELEFAQRKMRKDKNYKIVLINIDDCEMTDDFYLHFNGIDIIAWNDTTQHDKLIRDLKKWVGMQIEEKRVRCPHCGVVLEVQKKEGERELLLRGEVHAQHSLAARASELPRAIQLAAPHSVVKRLCLTYAGQEYALHDGRNIVGRKATTSKATVQIDTPDKTMSRQHAVIVVSPIANGERKVVLCDYQSKNGIYVNGQQLREGDEIRLADGNRIKMGDTTLIFRVKK